MKVILYSTGCPKCNVLKQKLDEVGIVYEVNSNVDEIMKLGVRSVPVLSVDGKLYLFMDAINWLNKIVNEA